LFFPPGPPQPLLARLQKPAAAAPAAAPATPANTPAATDNADPVDRGYIGRLR